MRGWSGVVVGVTGLAGRERVGRLGTAAGSTDDIDRGRVTRGGGENSKRSVLA